MRTIPFHKVGNRVKELNNLSNVLALSPGVLCGSLGYILNAPPEHSWEAGRGDGPISYKEGRGKEALSHSLSHSTDRKQPIINSGHPDKSDKCWDAAFTRD